MEIVKRGGENDGGGERGCSAFGSAAFRIGWWIGKRVAIAGAVMTSAPILIPPLLLFSTLALALSFPFGVYFAGISCATKIMDTLFPFSQSTVVERSSSFFDADNFDEVKSGKRGIFGTHREEQLREQLCALCYVLGHEASQSSSLADKMLSLCQFAGIERPAKVEQDGDLTEVEDNLLLLKSVVGVK